MGGLMAIWYHCPHALAIFPGDMHALVALIFSLPSSVGELFYLTTPMHLGLGTDVQVLALVLPTFCGCLHGPSALACHRFSPAHVSSFSSGAHDLLVEPLRRLPSGLHRAIKATCVLATSVTAFGWGRTALRCHSLLLGSSDDGD